VARSLAAKIAHLFLVDLLVSGCTERLGARAAEATDLTLAAVMDKMF
jgi:hypothetical protein